MGECFPSMQEHPGSDPQNHKTSTTLGPSFPRVLAGLGLLLESEVEGVLGQLLGGLALAVFYHLCQLLFCGKLGLN